MPFIDGVPVEVTVVASAVWRRVNKDRPSRGFVDPGWKDAGDIAAFQEAGWEFHTGSAAWHHADDGLANSYQSGILIRDEGLGHLIMSDHIAVHTRNASISDTMNAADVLFDGQRRLNLEKAVFDVRLKPVGNDILAAVTTAIQKLRGQEVYAEPIIIYHLLNNASFSATTGSLEPQWATIHLPEAFRSVKKQGDGIFAAVIDLGFNMHKSLAVEWQAAFDRNGTRTSPPSGTDHGTACAALIAAGSNRLGLTGAAPNAKLILVSVETVTPETALVEALELCVAGEMNRVPADVICCSLGPQDRGILRSQTLETALNEAGKGRSRKGTLVVWADIEKSLDIPSTSVEGYDPVLCVGGSLSIDAVAAAPCGFGKGLDLLAPVSADVLVVLSQSDSVIQRMTGTSVAAPQAAGVAALLLSNDISLTATKLTNYLRESCDRPGDASATHQNDIGFGRLNALKAVNEL